MTVTPWISGDRLTCRNLAVRVSNRIRRVSGDGADRIHRCGARVSRVRERWRGANSRSSSRTSRCKQECPIPVPRDRSLFDIVFERAEWIYHCRERTELHSAARTASVSSPDRDDPVRRERHRRIHRTALFTGRHQMRLSISFWHRFRVASDLQRACFEYVSSNSTACSFGNNTGGESDAQRAIRDTEPITSFLNRLSWNCRPESSIRRHCNNRSGLR